MKTKQNTNSRLTKNIFLLLLLFTGIVKAQIVNVPNINFKIYLIDVLNLDTNNDGNIQTAEALTLTNFACTDSTITDLTGIEAFTNLTTLYVQQMPLTSLNVATLTNLTYLSCTDTDIASLDVAPLVNLTYLDVRGCTNLTSLNVAPLINLTYLETTFDGLITNLDVSSLTNLTTLKCSLNSFTSIDLSNNTNLTNLDLGFVPLAVLDLSYQNQLTTLLCGGEQLIQLLMKNGVNETFDIWESPNLSYICVDESQIGYVNFKYSVNNPGGSASINSYCSFVPGGNYNSITGNIRYDADNNGCDASDAIFSGFRVSIDDGTTSGAIFTSNAGNYTFYTQLGSFNITPSIENLAWFNVSPTTVTIPFLDNNNNTATQDFCIAPNGIHPDIEVAISPVFFARPGFDATYQITYRNKGNQTVSGAVNLIFDDSRTDFVSANPLVDNLAVNSLSWNYSNLLPFQSRTITVTLNVNSPTETPAVNIGDVLNFEVSISPVVADENPLDNTFSYTQTVVGSYDPNNIICLEGDVVPATEIGNYLHYAINFENTGTFPAENVVVKTEVDVTKFDVGSLQLMSSNFAVDARITGNKVEFIYENIQLPIGGHGHVLLKIKTQNTLVTGDAVANRGDIFFDYNFPIDTGLANTVFQTLSNSVFEIDSSIAVYPNPAVNEVTITADNKIKAIQLYDAKGRIIKTSLTDDLASKLDVSNYSKGIYFLKITTEKGAQVQKLLKD